LASIFPIFHYLYTLLKKESKVKKCFKSKEMIFWRWAFFNGNKDQKQGK